MTHSHVSQAICFKALGESHALNFVTSVIHMWLIHSCTRSQATLIGALGGVMCSFSGHFIRVFCVQRLDVSVLQCVVVCCRVLQLQLIFGPLYSSLLRPEIRCKCVAVCCSVLPCVAVAAHFRATLFASSASRD